MAPSAKFRQHTAPATPGRMAPRARRRTRGRAARTPAWAAHRRRVVPRGIGLRDVSSGAARHPDHLRYSDRNALAGFSRDARVAGIVVARKVIAVISSVATTRMTGSDARTS